MFSKSAIQGPVDLLFPSETDVLLSTPNFSLQTLKSYAQRSVGNPAFIASRSVSALQASAPVPEVIFPQVPSCGMADHFPTIAWINQH